MTRLMLPGVLLLSLLDGGFEQRPFQDEGAAARAPAPGAATTQKADDAQARNEERFRAALAAVTLRGSWRMTDDLAGRAPLGEPREESYDIQSVEKLDADRWIINARIRFAGKDVTLPVVVRVVWAGDTPVITIDDVELPMLGKYSARVMIYRDFYCGTWFGPNYGGVMSGQLVREAATSRPASEP